MKEENIAKIAGIIVLILFVFSIIGGIIGLNEMMIEKGLKQRAEKGNIDYYNPFQEKLTDYLDRTYNGGIKK